MFKCITVNIGKTQHDIYVMQISVTLYLQAFNRLQFNWLESYLQSTHVINFLEICLIPIRGLQAGQIGRS